MITQAFILAAGLGTRMRPITDKIPKPMVELNGKSIITRIIDDLIEYGIKHIVINSFYKKELLKKHIHDYISEIPNPPKVEVIEEIPLLETGGGVVNALDYLDNNKAFFVINSDSVFLGDNVFSSLNLAWEDSMRALFLLTELTNAAGYDGKGDFTLDANLMLKNPENLTNVYAYAGIHITNPKNFEDTPKEPIKLMKIYDKFKVGSTYQGFHGVAYNGTWFHVGTPEAVKTTEEYLTTQRLGSHQKAE